MNKRQKEVLQASLDNEKEVLEALKKNYTKALADIKKNIRELQAMPQTQSKAYQIEFQKQLESQISAYLDILKGNNFKSINEYYNKCYENGFIGSQYSLQGFGEGITIPIDQNEVVNAMKMTCDGIKLSDKLGGDTQQLKKDVVSEMQRGFSTEMQYTDIARNISALGQASMARAMRIARTEGGRIQCKADLDCAYRAKELGCDTVKQWNATLDRKTRPSHQRVDKEWRELDEPFSNGLMYPKDPNGSAAEVVNCRCSLDDVPRWYVEAGGGQYRREGITGNIIKCKNYAEFKEKYLQKIRSGDILNGGYDEKDIIRAINAKTANFVTTDINNYESLYGEFVENVPKKAGYYDIKAHGSNSSIKIYNSVVDENELAKILFSRINYNGENIRLLSCFTGSEENGTCFAQKLADLLKVNVLAPDGEIKVSSNSKIVNESIMKLFKPKGD